MHQNKLIQWMGMAGLSKRPQAPPQFGISPGELGKIRVAYDRFESLTMPSKKPKYFLIATNTNPPRYPWPVPERDMELESNKYLKRIGLLDKGAVVLASHFNQAAATVRRGSPDEMRNGVLVWTDGAPVNPQEVRVVAYRNNPQQLTIAQPHIDKIQRDLSNRMVNFSLPPEEVLRSYLGIKDKVIGGLIKTPEFGLEPKEIKRLTKLLTLENKLTDKNPPSGYLVEFPGKVPKIANNKKEIEGYFKKIEEDTFADEVDKNWKKYQRKLKNNPTLTIAKHKSGPDGKDVTISRLTNPRELQQTLANISQEATGYLTKIKLPPSDLMTQYLEYRDRKGLP